MLTLLGTSARELSEGLGGKLFAVVVKGQAEAKKALDEVEGLSKVTAVASGPMVRGLAALGKFFRGG